MSTDSVIKEEYQKTDMDIKDCTDEEKKNNSEICMSGIELPSIEDENRFQTRHFSNTTSSNILFCEMPTCHQNVPSENTSVDKEELLFPSDGLDIRYANEKQLDRRHFHSPSEYYAQSEHKENQDGQFYSSGTVQLTDVPDQNQTQRHHFHKKTSSDIFFCNLPTESNVSSGSASVDREELLFPSAGHDTRYADQKQLERRHFHSLSEDYIEPERSTNQDKHGDLSGTIELTKFETNGVNQNKTQRQHFHERTSSDVFFHHLPTEGSVSSGSANVDKEELLFPSAGHDTRYADQKQGERLHFHSSEDYVQPEDNTNGDEHVDSSETTELAEVEIHGCTDENQTQRQHFHDKTSSDIFFRHLPTDDVSSGSVNVDREELLFPSAGHDTRYADQKQGERLHFHSLEDYVQPEDNTNGDEHVDSSETTELVEVEIHGCTDENQTQRQHFHDKTSSDIFFRHLPTDNDVSSGSVNVDREELLFPSAGHDTRYADQKQGERRHFH